MILIYFTRVSTFLGELLFMKENNILYSNNINK